MSPLPRSHSVARCPKTKLLLFCSHPVAQERFSRLLRRGGLQVVISSEFHLPLLDGYDAVPNRAAIIDAEDNSAALDLVRTIRDEHRDLHVLVLLPKLVNAVAYPLLRLGVKGLLPYALASRELSRAALQVAAGAYWVPRDLLTGFVQSILPELQGCKSLDSEEHISRREREVLDLLLDNLSNKEIATKLFVSERTVKFHVSNLLSKFGVQRRADLIVLWMQRNRMMPIQPSTLTPVISAHIN